jgi:AcrR family transcriptional regulator
MAALPRFQNLEPERRERLLAAAGVEFAEHGFASASVNRILDRAGLSKGVLYYYFEDKSDLFRTTLERALTHLFEAGGMPAGPASLERWVTDLDGERFWEALRDMSRQSLGMLRSDAWYVRLARSYHRIRHEPDGLALTGEVEVMGRRMLDLLLNRGRDLGVVRTDLPVDLLVECALALDHAADAWILERLDALDDDELARVMDARTDMMRDMLGAEHPRWEES